MSINIKTAAGLQEIGGSITKEKIVSALQYEPANKTALDADKAALNEHIDNKTTHVSDTDRASWDNKDYNALKNKPHIEDDGSSVLAIADTDNNIIAKFDADGLHTTRIETDGLHATRIEADSFDSKGDNLIINDKDGNIIFKVDSEGTHTTNIEATSFVSKDDKLIINDEFNNIIFKIDKDGAHTTELTLNGGKVDERLAKLSGDLTIHESASDDTNGPIHIQPGERTKWDKKATTKYVDDSVSSLKKDISEKLESESSTFVIADSENRKAFEVTSDGTTDVAKLTINGKDIEEALDNTITANASDDDVVVLSGTGGTNTVTYDAKHKVYDSTNTSTKTYTKVNVDKYGHVTAGSTPTTLADYGITDAVLSSRTINDKALTANITLLAADVGLGNVNNTSDADKPVSTAQEAALAALKAELSENIESETPEFTIVDESGNMAIHITKTGYTKLSEVLIAKDAYIKGDLTTDKTIYSDSDITANGNIHALCDVVADETVYAPYIKGSKEVKAPTIVASTSIVAPQITASTSIIAPQITATSQLSSYHISATGNITASGTVTATDFNSLSDARLKTNITDYVPSESILNLPLKEFDYIKSNVHTIGCLAQDLVTIAPELVDTDAEGFMSIKESKLVYLLLFELQKMNKRLDKLERNLKG